MTTTDQCCALYPYFQVHEGKLEAFRELCQQFIAQTSKETQCLYYGFSFNGDKVHCREGYTDAAGLLAHLQNVDSILQAALQIADVIQLEVHGPESELAKLREPLASFNPEYFTLECGFRN